MYNRFFIFIDFFVQDDLVAVFFYDESKASAKVIFISMVFLYLASVMNLVKWLEFELWMAKLYLSFLLFKTYLTLLILG